jgi:putative acetyltransferase
MEKTTTTLSNHTAPPGRPTDLSGLTLRPLRVSDAEAFHAMCQQPQAFHHGSTRLPYGTLAQTREWIEKLAPSNVAIVAVLGDALVGTAELYVNGRRRAHSASLGIGVHDDFHGLGIGKRLLAELIDVADNWLGLRRLELHVFVDNERAIALYRQFGFEIEARLRGCVLRDGELIDDYLMARLVDAPPLAAEHR